MKDRLAFEIQDAACRPRRPGRRGEVQGGAVLLIVIVLLLALGLVIALRPKPAERPPAGAGPPAKAYARESLLVLLGDFPGAKAIEAAVAAVPDAKHEPLPAEFNPEQGSGPARHIGAEKKAALVAWSAAGSPEARFEILRAPRYVEMLEEQGCRVIEVPDIESLAVPAEGGYAADLAGALVRDQAGDTSATLAAYGRALTALGDADTTAAATLRVLRGNAALVARKTDAALADYERALELAPEHDVALAGRAAVRTLRRDFAGALADSRRAVALGNQQPGVSVNAGIAAHLTGDAAKAAEAFDAVLKARPDDAAALVNRCQIYFTRRKDRESAEKDADRAIELAPHLAGAWYSRGWLHASAERHGKAIEDFSEAIRLAPDFTPAWYKRANAFNTEALVKGNEAMFKKAIEDYSAVIEREPNHVKAINNRGAAYASLRDYERAIRDFSRAIELLPGDAQLYYNRGMAYVETGNAEAAKQDFFKSIDITPDGQQKIRSMGELEKLGFKFTEEGAPKPVGPDPAAPAAADVPAPLN